MAEDWDERELRDSKFAHLLRPLKDLADNWSVDVASELEEYLDHLERTTFSFGDGGQVLDFAEAALLIQSSACVYSKKVEYLHNLVYQALEAVRSKRRNDDNGTNDVAGAAPQRDRPGRIANNHTLDEDETLEAFLQAGLDLKVADDIDLADDDEAQAPAYVRPPAALLALEDQGSGLGDGDAGFFRLAQCFVHCSGALLLDVNDSMLYDEFLNNVCGASATATAPWEERQAAMVQQAAPSQQQQQQQQKAEDSDDDDDGGDGGGMEDDDDDDEGAAPGAHQQQQAAAASQQQPALAPAPGAAAAAAGPPQADGAPKHAEAGEDDEEQEVFDPYKPLDVHAKGSLPVRPMTVRRPPKNRRPPMLVSAQQAAARAAAAGGAAAAAYLAPGAAAFGFGVAGQDPWGQQQYVPGLVHQEFAYAAELVPSRQQQRAGGAAAAARAAAVKRQQQKARNAGGAVALMAMLDPAAAAAAAQEELAGWADGVGGAGDAGAAAGGAADMAGDDFGMGEGPAGFGDDDDDVGGGYAGGDDAGDLEDFMQSLRPGAGMMALDGAGGADGGDGVQSYEDLCRAHIEGMIAAAAAQEVQSELAQRVSGWRTKIDPVLKAEETRHVFDIQQYGSKILNRLTKKEAPEAPQPEPEAPAADVTKSPVAFGSVATGMEKFEVSRTFAAMLQLINNRNVAIHKGTSPDSPFRLQLLTTELPQDAMARNLGGGAAAGAAPRRGGKKGGGSQRAAAASGGDDAADDDGDAAMRDDGGEEGGDGAGVDDGIDVLGGIDGGAAEEEEEDQENARPGSQRGKAAGGGGGKAAGGKANAAVVKPRPQKKARA